MSRDRREVLLASRGQWPRHWVWKRVSRGRGGEEGVREVTLESRSKQGPSHAADTKRFRKKKKGERMSQVDKDKMC